MQSGCCVVLSKAAIRFVRLPAVVKTDGHLAPASGFEEEAGGTAPSGIDWLDCGARRTLGGGGGAPLERRAHLARAPSSGHREDVGLGLEGSR